MKIRRLLGAALTVPLLIGALVLVTAGPAVACSCAMVRSESECAARADAVFVGQLISRVDRIDPRVERAVREFTRTSNRAVVARAMRNDSSRTVWTFQVSRVYKGAVGNARRSSPRRAQRAGPTAAASGGYGIPARSHSWCSRTTPQVTWTDSNPGQYASNMCSGSRPLADGGPPTGAPGWPNKLPSMASLAAGIGLLTAVVMAGLAILRTRRHPSSD